MKIGPYTADEDLFEATRRDHERRVRVYRPDGILVVLGRGSKPGEEIRQERCSRDGVPVMRRRGGGCAVVLDPGNVIVTVAEHAPGLGDNRRHFARLSGWLVDGLERAGFSGVHPAGISDLARGDRKVAGACLHRSRDTLLYAASLLIDPDITLLESYLRHPPREPDYRRGRAHADFVGSLSAGIGQHEMEELVRRLVRICR